MFRPQHINQNNVPGFDVYNINMVFILGNTTKPLKKDVLSVEITIFYLCKDFMFRKTLQDIEMAFCIVLNFYNCTDPQPADIFRGAK